MICTTKLASCALHFLLTRVYQISDEVQKALIFHQSLSILCTLNVILLIKDVIENLSFFSVMHLPFIKDGLRLSKKDLQHL